MKNTLLCIICSFVCSSFLYAQDTITLSPKDYEDVEEIYPAKKQGWLFKQGSDTTWARKDLDVSTWKKFRPVDINASMVDANGVFEGWFRAYIKIDSTFGDIMLYAFFNSYAAQDLFIDGKLILSSGNTGFNSKPYRENFKIYQSLNKVHLSQLLPGSIHLIVWHIKDTKASLLNATKLKGELLGVHNLFEIVTADFNEWSVARHYFLNSTLIAGNSILFVLFILFFLLWRLNKSEKNLLDFTIFIGVFFLLMSNQNYFRSIWYPVDLSYSSEVKFSVIHMLMYTFLFSYTTIIVSKLFDHKYSFIGKWFVLGSIVIFPLFFFNIITTPFQVNIENIFIIIIFISLAYFIITSRKKIDKNNRIIVGGIIAVIFFQLLIQITSADAIYRYKMFFTLLFLSGISFPISLLIYVAVRFKAILTEVQNNANTIVRLSEEKRIQAENQQKVLENEVAKQTVDLRNSLNELKATQSQLIQSEKMASLGELTAGIAHEIQNPLNFVNNFSEVSTELVDEMNEEIKKGNLSDAKEIANDLKQNLEKINHHGQRAADIVKGMLQHSRSSSGVKEPTDINALADEYVRLAFHGLRAKDKSFNATLKTDFDETIGNISIIPQDIGRVILNLITNAFYVVNEKSKQGIADYEPTVSVSTKRLNNQVEISVTDNGNGIPPNILDKIFQPFFTTKPTGQGTGLGLSLSYDIVKAHGGELKVETKEDDRTTFTIFLQA